MAIDVLSNYVEATVTTGGTTAPAAGTVETWTVTTTENWPVLASGQQIRVMDKAQLGSASGYEIMLATAMGPGQLTTALASGTAYTSLAVSALADAIASGDGLTLISGSTTQTTTANAAAAAGATTIDVGPAPVGTLTTALTSGTAYTSLATSTLSAALSVGEVVTLVDSGVASQPFAVSAAAASGATSVAVCALAPGTLSAALASGTAYTSLAVTALTAAVASGDSLTLVSGSTTQVVTASAAAASGAKSISVTSFTASAAFPIGTTVLDTTTPLTASAAFPTTTHLVVSPFAASAAFPDGTIVYDATSGTANGTGVAWQVTRGLEGTTPVAHVSDWTAVPATTAANMTSGRLLGSCSYAPSIGVQYAPSSVGVLLPMDPVNVTCAFRAPASGTVWATIAPGYTNSGYVGFGLTDHTTGSQVGAVAFTNSGQSLPSSSQMVTGLTPGDQYQWDLALGTNTGNAGIVRVQNWQINNQYYGAPATMAVWAI